MNAVLAPIDTKTRILDAAERLFSQDGFDAASLRTITAAAQVNLAAVNYHFHSKEALFSAVIERRARPINKRRLELLEAIPGKLNAERILDAFLRPAMERSAAELSCFRPLMARLHSVPLELHTRIIEENFAPTLNRFVDALSEALPCLQRGLEIGHVFRCRGYVASLGLGARHCRIHGEGLGPRPSRELYVPAGQLRGGGLASKRDPAGAQATNQYC